MSRNRSASQLVFLTAILCGAITFLIAAYALMIRGLFSSTFLGIVSVAYIAVGLAGLRGHIDAGAAPRLIAGLGAAFALIECTNIILEEFVGLPAPWNAIVPASAMGAMILAAAVAAVTVSSSAGIAEAIIASVFVIGIGVAVSCSAGLFLIAITGSDLSQGISNATMHLVLPLIVAAAVGAFAATASAVSNTRVLIAFSAAGSIALIIGIRLLVKAASLPRPQRPAFVMPGMFLAALGLALVPSFLAYFQNFHHGVLTTPDPS